MASLMVSSLQYHRHHAGLLRYDGDELVPSKSLEKELHEIQAKCAGKGTLSPIIMEVENYADFNEPIILEIHIFHLTMLVGGRVYKMSLKWTT